jgi:calcineurin-like phosphoesterase family protein
MSRRQWIVSDTHFGHRLLADGVLRPWSNVDDMNAALIERWNAVVQPTDRVYHLGDVCINRRYLHSVLPQLHGRKVLCKGNHDIFKLADYLPYFEDIRAYKVIEQVFVLSHIPIHPQQLNRYRVNVHGHLHEHVLPDPRYVNCCVEHTNYTPILLDEVRGRCAT